MVLLGRTAAFQQLQETAATPRLACGRRMQTHKEHQVQQMLSFQQLLWQLKAPPPQWPLCLRPTTGLQLTRGPQRLKRPAPRLKMDNTCQQTLRTKDGRIP